MNETPSLYGACTAHNFQQIKNVATSLSAGTAHLIKSFNKKKCIGT